ADLGKPCGEVLGVDEVEVGLLRGGRDGVGVSAELLRRRALAFLYTVGGGQQHRVADLLDVAAGDGFLAVTGEDDLTLFGDLEPAVDRPGCLGEQCPAGGTAAPAQGAAAP